jgi:Tautomerase enzyme
VTYPLDTKQCRKIIIRCWKLADRSEVRLRRRYRKEVRACIMAQRARIRAGERRHAVPTGRPLTMGGALIRAIGVLRSAIRQIPCLSFVSLFVLAAGNFVDPSDCVYRTMHETMNVPSATASGSSPNRQRRLICDPDYLDVHRTGGILFIQVTLNAGRTLNVERAFYARVAGLA